MRLIFMGTPEIASTVLEALIGSEHEILAAVCQPDKQKGRGNAVQFPPVKVTALHAGIPVYQPAKARDPEFVKLLDGLKADGIVVAAYGQILPESILNLTKYGCLNVHASLLPAYRGADPIQWAVINGEEVTGVTIMQMDKGLDTGDILTQETVPLAPDETGDSLYEKLGICGAQLLLRTLKELEEGTVVPVKQPAESTTAYASRLDKQMGHLDWMRPAEELERLVRGLNSWPAAYSYLDGKMLKFWKTEVEPQGDMVPVKPGTVCKVEKKSFSVQTGEGLLKILEVQLEGKKRMPADAFLRGFALKKGTELG